jgi:hypothetical protein
MEEVVEGVLVVVSLKKMNISNKFRRWILLMSLLADMDGRMPHCEEMISATTTTAAALTVRPAVMSGWWMV